LYLGQKGTEGRSCAGVGWIGRNFIILSFSSSSSISLPYVLEALKVKLVSMFCTNGSVTGGARE
jgi:hypothetical protein